jgi:succinate dehydrogenase / fumarate reductase cytochrome b subunit
MIWTGLITGAFLIYHLLHFTIQVIDPAASAGINADAMGRPDVAGMVITGFQNFFIALIYVAAMVALLMHLIHGIQSSFQTLGMNNDRTLPAIIKTGSFAAIILFLGYVSIPVIIFLGLMKG